MVIFGRAYQKGLVLRRLLNVGIVNWYVLQEPWTPGCTGLLTAPKWYQSCYWSINVSLSMVAATFLRAGWLSFSGHPSPPHPSKPPTETMKGKQCRCCLRQASKNVFRLFCIAKTPQRCFRHVGFCNSVHDTHFVNTIGPFLQEVTDHKVDLQFYGLWCMWLWWGFGPF